MYLEKIFVRDLPSEMQQENRMGIGNFVNFFFCRVPLFAMYVSLSRFMDLIHRQSCQSV